MQPFEPFEFDEDDTDIEEFTCRLKELVCEPTLNEVFDESFDLSMFFAIGEPTPTPPTASDLFAGELSFVLCSSSRRVLTFGRRRNRRDDRYDG